jgi:hypothetical protein
MANKLEPVCVIHFEGKKGELLKLQQASLNKIVERRKQWLNLSSSSYAAFTEVAKKSFMFIGDSENLNIESLVQTCCYHPACYRNFTDITKIERAKKVLTTNAGQKRSANPCSVIADSTDTNNPQPKKIPRLTRKSSQNVTGHSSRSPNVLPQICLICKRGGPIYFTDKVTYISVINVIM